MTILEDAYAPAEHPNTGVGDYVFGYDTIGLDATEVWAIDGSGGRVEIASTEWTAVFDGVAPLYDGGTITITGTIPIGTVTISIERNTPITQLVDFTAYNDFPADVLEFTLDKLTMICQEIEYRKCDTDEPPP